MDTRHTSGLPVLLLPLFWATVCFGYVRVCYFTNWSQFRPPPGRFLPEDVDPFLCTHVNFAFADIRGNSVVPVEFNDQEMYGRLVALKEANPNLKVLLAVGGWLAGGAGFSALVSSEQNMIEFANNVITYLRNFSLDGLDVDWEYPADTERGSVPADRIRFTRLLQLLRAGFEQESRATGRPRLLLTAAVAAEIEASRTFYQIPEMARSLDFINLMTYDFHGQWDIANGARHHSALYPETDSAVQGWLQEGFPANKIVLGTATFARTFTLETAPTGTGVGQTAINVGAPGNFSDNAGLLTYHEVCSLLKTQGWERIWLDDQQVPVAFGNIANSTYWGWAGYDDPESLRFKADYIRENDLAGAMVWSLACDDFNDYCGDGPYPLMRTLKRLLPDDSIDSPDFPSSGATPIPRATSSTATTATTERPITFPYNTTRWLTPPRSDPRDEDIPPVAVDPSPDPEGESGYRQCSISDTFGPNLRCTNHHGKTGFRTRFYLYCFNGFFAIECSCLPGFFYNRCRRACDSESNFLSCPLI